MVLLRRTVPLVRLVLVFCILAWTTTNSSCNAQETTSPSDEILLTPLEFYELNSNGLTLGGGIIIDVRDGSLWFRDGHIENATHVENFASLLTRTPVAMINATLRLVGIFECLERCTVVIYCRSARVAGISIDLLRNRAGFISANIYNGQGTNDWAEAGYPLVSDPSFEPPCMTDPASTADSINGVCPRIATAVPTPAPSPAPQQQPETPAPFTGPQQKQAPPAKCGSLANDRGRGGAAADAKDCSSRRRNIRGL